VLIACANIANLLLARGAARAQEMAIRIAVGAGAARILRQFLAEGILLALLGGAAGLLVANWGIALLIHFGATGVPRLVETSIDWRVVAFTFGLCLGSGILFSFGPAGGLRVRRFLMASELALAIVLLTGAGLMAKSFWKMYANPPGSQTYRAIFCNPTPRCLRWSISFARAWFRRVIFTPLECAW
jgi:ABC-type antimicrobial peptide transport system permease subunit